MESEVVQKGKYSRSIRKMQIACEDQQKEGVQNGVSCSALDNWFPSSQWFDPEVLSLEAMKTLLLRERGSLPEEIKYHLCMNLSECTLKRVV